MSVSAGTQKADGYEDMEWLQFYYDNTSKPGDRSNNDARLLYEPGFQYEMDAELGRDEVAELVYLEIPSFGVGERPSSGSNETPSRIDCSVELSTSPTAFFESPNSGSSIDNPDTGTGTRGYVGPEWDSQVFAELNGNSGAVVVDSTNQLGAGDTDFTQPTFEYHYRDMFGEGPILDRHDTLYWHSALKGINSPNRQWQMQTVWRMGFDVYEDPR
jgi:hypothetical protein